MDTFTWNGLAGTIQIVDESCDDWNYVPTEVESAICETLDKYIGETGVTSDKLAAAAKSIWHEVRKYAETLEPTDYDEDWQAGDHQPEVQCLVGLEIAGISADYEDVIQIG